MRFTAKEACSMYSRPDGNTALDVALRQIKQAAPRRYQTDVVLSSLRGTTGQDTVVEDLRGLGFDVRPGYSDQPDVFEDRTWLVVSWHPGQG